MNDSKSTVKFWLGNGVLALGLLMLIFIELLWEVMGNGAIILWIIVVGGGIYLLMSDKREPPIFPG